MEKKEFTGKKRQGEKTEPFDKKKIFEENDPEISVITVVTSSDSNRQDTGGINHSQSPRNEIQVKLKRRKSNRKIQKFDESKMVIKQSSHIITTGRIPINYDGETLYACIFCGEVSLNKNLVKNHIKSCHNSSTIPQFCMNDLLFRKHGNDNLQYEEIQRINKETIKNYFKDGLKNHIEHGYTFPGNECRLHKDSDTFFEGMLGVKCVNLQPPPEQKQKKKQSKKNVQQVSLSYTNNLTNVSRDVVNQKSSIQQTNQLQNNFQTKLQHLPGQGVDDSTFMDITLINKKDIDDIETLIKKYKELIGDDGITQNPNPISDIELENDVRKLLNEYRDFLEKNLSNKEIIKEKRKKLCFKLVDLTSSGVNYDFCAMKRILSIMGDDMKEEKQQYLTYLWSDISINSRLSQSQINTLYGFISVVFEMNGIKFIGSNTPVTQYKFEREKYRKEHNETRISCCKKA